MWLTEGSWWSLSKLIWPHSLCPFLFTLIPIFNNLFIFELFSFHLPSFLFFYFHLDLLVFLISFSPFPPPSLCGTQGSFPIYGQYGTSDVSYVLSVCDSVVYVKMEFDVFFSPWLWFKKILHFHRLCYVFQFSVSFSALYRKYRYLCFH